VPRPTWTLAPIRAWILVACVAGMPIAAAPAAAQSPDAVAAAKDLMVTMRSADQFKAIDADLG
jgi:hypothetical protein